MFTGADTLAYYSLPDTSEEVVGITLSLYLSLIGVARYSKSGRSRLTAESAGWLKCAAPLRLNSSHLRTNSINFSSISEEKTGSTPCKQALEV